MKKNERILQTLSDKFTAYNTNPTEAKLKQLLETVAKSVYFLLQENIKNVLQCCI